MRTKKRAFSLLEVLICLALISIALPLLVAPFLYESANLSEEIKLNRENRKTASHLAALLEAFHTKKLLLVETPKQEWGQYEGIPYQLKKIAPEEPAAKELWNLTLKQGKGVLEYHLIGVNP